MKASSLANFLLGKFMRLCGVRRFYNSRGGDALVREHSSTEHFIQRTFHPGSYSSKRRDVHGTHNPCDPCSMGSMITETQVQGHIGQGHTRLRIICSMLHTASLSQMSSVCSWTLETKHDQYSSLIFIVYVRGWYAIIVVYLCDYCNQLQYYSSCI